MLEELPFQEAATFVDSPYLTEPIYPFGDITAQAKTNTVSSSRTAGHSKGKKRKMITPTDDISLRKYDDSKLVKNQGIPYQVFQSLVPTSMHNNHWYRIFLKLHSTTVSVGTWSKYNSAFQKFNKYCTLFQIPAKWPLEETWLHGFTMWALYQEKLNPDTVKAYIFALSRIQKMHGGVGISIAKSPTLSLLITGARNHKIARHPQKGRETITFARMQILRRKIFSTHWSSFNKLAIWCVSLVCFFGSFRPGELLTKRTGKFDKTTNLLGKYVRFDGTSNTWHFWIKSPKTGNPQGESVYLFPFSNPLFCPVYTLNKYMRSLQENHLFSPDLPFFRFESGRNITIKKLNAILENFLPLKGNKKLTAHCFRSGFISSAANLPDEVNDPHLKGWGRWKSNTFLRYELFDLEQKRWIFNRLVQSLKG
jgi:hypothetical protein